MVYVFKAAIQGPEDPAAAAVAGEEAAAASSPSPGTGKSGEGVIRRGAESVYSYLISSQQSNSMHGSHRKEQTILHRAG